MMAWLSMMVPSATDVSTTTEKVKSTRAPRGMEAKAGLVVESKTTTSAALAP